MEEGCLLRARSTAASPTPLDEQEKRPTSPCRRRSSVVLRAHSGRRVPGAREDAPVGFSGPEEPLKETGARAAIYGRVALDEGTVTSVAGVLAAEEVADGRYRQTAEAVGDGCRAAIDAERWIEEQGGTGRLRGT